MADKIDSQSTTTQGGERNVYDDLVSQVDDLIYWRNMIKSGLVFATGLFTFFVLTVGGYTIIGLLANLLLWFLVISFAYTNGTLMLATFQGKTPVNPHVARWGDAKISITKETTQEYIDLILPYVNKGIEFAKDVAFCKNNMTTLKVIGALWLISIIGNLFSGLTLLFLEFFLAFTVPRLYEMNKQQVDKVAQVAYEQSKVYYEMAAKMIMEKLPKASDLNKKKTQ